MIIFETTVGELEAQKSNLNFYDQITKNYSKYVKTYLSAGERLSWQNSLRALSTILEKSEIDKNKIKLLSLIQKAIYKGSIYNYQSKLILAYEQLCKFFLPKDCCLSSNFLCEQSF